jgi:hypothetical protein
MAVIALIAATATPSQSAEATKMKYRNCKAVNKVYPGGVAKSASSRNKGGDTQNAPKVNKSLYTNLKSLDRDKDGIACEK